MLQQRRKQRIVLLLSLAVVFILACATLIPNGSNSSAESTQPAVASQSTDVPGSSASTEDIETRIKSASALVFENTWGLDIALTQVVQSALDGMGMKNYTYTRSDNGVFMQDLQSDTKYDLIIVDQEVKDITITGDFWDVINKRLTEDKAALIIEM